MMTEQEQQSLLNAAEAVCNNYDYKFEDLEFEPHLERLVTVVKEIKQKNE